MSMQVKECSPETRVPFLRAAAVLDLLRWQALRCQYLYE